MYEKNKLNLMAKHIYIVCVLLVGIFYLTSCSTSKSVVSRGADISKYSYVVFGGEITGDRELDDIGLLVQNEIAATNLKVVSASEGISKIALGEYVLTPNINVTTEKWDGGRTYIVITFYDYDTNQIVAVLKSSGIGLIISQDQSLALNGIRKKLNKIFKKSGSSLKQSEHEVFI
ncbi:MAG: hypothetical protein LUI04_01955 [Porphyromonadaceae bacterium]|nr:hypothetical protein [Porphyromonadaceae bacterium]